MKNIEHLFHNFFIFNVFFECFNDVPANSWRNFFFVDKLFFDQFQWYNRNPGFDLPYTLVCFPDASPRF